MTIGKGNITVTKLTYNCKWTDININDGIISPNGDIYVRQHFWYDALRQNIAHKQWYRKFAYYMSISNERTVIYHNSDNIKSKCIEVVQINDVPPAYITNKEGYTPLCDDDPPPYSTI